MFKIIPPIIDAVAIPVTPPSGAEDIATLGGVRYPPPLFVTAMNLIPPLTIPLVAVAVDPVPIKVRVCECPTSVEIPSSDCPSDSPPVRTSSISSIPVSITSSPTR